MSNSPALVNSGHSTPANYANIEALGGGRAKGWGTISVRTSFAPETTSSNRNKRNRTEAKIQQNHGAWTSWHARKIFSETGNLSAVAGILG